jgi:glycosyltransferase involved in cell wall biosynthesis
MKILILAPYPHGEAPSQRFRFEQYLGALRDNQIEYDFEPFLDLKTWQILHKPGRFWAKLLGVMRAFVRRMALMFRLKEYQYVFIHREASHVGPPIFEFLIWLLNKKIVYDFDDAIWLPNYSEHNAAFHRLKMYKKVCFSMRWSYKIAAGNDYLAEFAKKYNKNVVILPTTIDTEHHHNQIKIHQNKTLTIGWTGTLTTMRYLNDVVPVLRELEEEFEFKTLIISNQAPDFNLRGLVFQHWNKETEIEDLLKLDVGLMPLEDDIWAKGKCGFKALQYMALGIPPLVSPVGVNTQIVAHAENGFVCAAQQDWYQSIKRLLTEPELRAKLGESARKTVEKNYSVISQKDKFLSLFA